MPDTRTAEGTHDNYEDALEFPPKDRSTGGERTERKPLEPYRPIFHSNSKQFEYGEDRRYRQIVFHFQEKPEQDLIDKLKSHGYKWRSDDKSWRVQADAVTRVEASRLANEIHGEEPGVSR
jgi:hypothetical protein